VATGFRGSSVQGAGAFNDQSVAKPEEATSIEAGVKGELFDRRARLNFGVFNYTVKDFQLTAVGGAGNANILLNADKVTGRGFELDLQAYLTGEPAGHAGRGLQRHRDQGPEPGGVALQHHAVRVRPARRAAPNCTVTDPMVGGKALVDGNPLPQAPKTNLHFTLKYSQPMGSGEAYVMTDWVYRSKINFFIYESMEFTGKPLTEGGVRLGYIWGNGKYEAALFGRNITNQIRIVGGIDFDNLTGFINEPRTWGAQFRNDFLSERSSVRSFSTAPPAPPPGGGYWHV
jgi:iron complex outermembrane receptor protein